MRKGIVERFRAARERLRELGVVIDSSASEREGTMVKCCRCGGTGAVPIATQYEGTIAALRDTFEPASAILRRLPGLHRMALLQRLYRLERHGIVERKAMGRFVMWRRA